MKVFQLIYGDIDSTIDECLRSVRSVYSDVIVYRYEQVENPIKESDNRRVSILNETDDCLYIDWDVMLYDRLSIDIDKLCCNYHYGAPDYSIIYSPKKEFWDDIIRERSSRGISIFTYAWIRKLLRDKDIAELKDNFEHLRYSKVGK
jgi:hypothetical protein